MILCETWSLDMDMTVDLLDLCDISAALNVHADDPLLHVYNSTQEKLEAVTDLYDKQKRQVVVSLQLVVF